MIGGSEWVRVVWDLEEDSLDSSSSIRALYDTLEPIGKSVSVGYFSPVIITILSIVVVVVQIEVGLF